MQTAETEARRALQAAREELRKAKAYGRPVRPAVVDALLRLPHRRLGCTAVFISCVRSECESLIAAVEATGDAQQAAELRRRLAQLLSPKA